MSDETAAARYGCPDVFELAERLYAMTARSPAAAPPPAGALAQPSAPPPAAGRGVRPARALLRGGAPTPRRAQASRSPCSCSRCWSRGAAVRRFPTLRTSSSAAAGSDAPPGAAAGRLRLRGGHGGAHRVRGRCQRRAGHVALVLGAAQSLYLLAATASLCRSRGPAGATPVASACCCARSHPARRPPPHIWAGSGGPPSQLAQRPTAPAARYLVTCGAAASRWRPWPRSRPGARAAAG